MQRHINLVVARFVRSIVAIIRTIPIVLHRDGDITSRASYLDNKWITTNLDRGSIGSNGMNGELLVVFGLTIGNAGTVRIGFASIALFVEYLERRLVDVLAFQRDRHGRS